MTDHDDTKQNPAAIPILEEVVIPGELFTADASEAAETPGEETLAFGQLVDELVDRLVLEAVDEMIPVLKRNLRSQLNDMLPALLAAARDRDMPNPPDKR